MKRTRRDEALIETRVRGAALANASDADICAMAGIAPAELERYREIIDRGRASALASLKFHRMRAQAKHVAKRGNE